MRKVMWVAAAIVLWPGRPLTAQYPTGSGGMGGMDGGTERRPEGRRAAPPVFTAEQLEGPPAPDFFQSYVDLTPEQLPRYTQLYDSYMAATSAQRDTVTAVRAALQQAFQARDRGAIRANAPELRRLGEALAGRLREFDKQVKKLLTKDQWKTYHDWQDQQRQAAEEEQRARMPAFDERPGGP